MPPCRPMPLTPSANRACPSVEGRVSETPRDPASRASIEDFRAAQGRHRFAARLRAIPAVLAAAVMGIPLSVYLSPVLLALAILVTDLVNFVIPMPDVGGAVMGLPRPPDRRRPGHPRGDRLDPRALADPGGHRAWWSPTSSSRWRLRRIGGDGIARGDRRARPPDPGDPEERQLVDVVGELAIAAGIDPPRVLLYDDGPANALRLRPRTRPRDGRVGRAHARRARSRGDPGRDRAAHRLRRRRRPRSGDRHRCGVRDVRPADDDPQRRREPAAGTGCAPPSGRSGAVGTAIRERTRGPRRAARPASRRRRARQRAEAAA